MPRQSSGATTHGVALKSTQQQLEDVQAAIDKCLAAQSYSDQDVTVQRAQLQSLQEREERLLQRLASEQGTDFAFATFARRCR